MGQKMKHVEIGRTKIYYHKFIMMLLHHLAPELSTQLADHTVKECYRNHHRIFNDLNREAVKMADKLKKKGKPFPDMVFPQVMKYQLIDFDYTKYTLMFVSVMAQGLDMVNPHVPNQSTSSSIPKKPTKLKHRRLVISKSPASKMPTSVVSQRLQL